MQHNYYASEIWCTEHESSAPLEDVSVLAELIYQCAVGEHELSIPIDGRLVTTDVTIAVEAIKKIHQDHSDISANNMLSLAKFIPGVRVCSNYQDDVCCTSKKNGDFKHHKMQVAFVDGDWYISGIYDKFGGKKQNGSIL